MPNVFDATLKDLVDTYVRDYEIALHLAAGQPLTPTNVDLSVVSAATDIVLASKPTNNDLRALVQGDRGGN